jgi:hypothetical protein
MDADNKIWTPDQRLLALSLKQPYAELMLHGKIETRPWNTNYRGWVLICISKIGYTWEQIIRISGDYQVNRMRQFIDFSHIHAHGTAIAIGKLTDCRPMQPRDENRCFVKYGDLYCHVYTDVRAIEPFEWKGSQGWKEVSQEIRDQIKFL